MADNSGAYPVTCYKLEKEKRIKKEATRLRGIFRDLDENKKKAVENLIKRAAFMSVALEDLEETINAEGFTDEYQNGENQRGFKESPETKIHLAMMKNYAAVIRQLAELAPPARRKDSRLRAMREDE